MVEYTDLTRYYNSSGDFSTLGGLQGSIDSGVNIFYGTFVAELDSPTAYQMIADIGLGLRSVKKAEFNQGDKGLDSNALFETGSSLEQSVEIFASKYLVPELSIYKVDFYTISPSIEDGLEVYERFIQANDFLFQTYDAVSMEEDFFRGLTYMYVLERQQDLIF